MKSKGNLDEEEEEDEPSEKPGFQAEPERLKAGIVLKNLRKKFGRNKVAVDGLSVKMFDGEIFALLGKRQSTVN